MNAPKGTPKDESAASTETSAETPEKAKANARAAEARAVDARAAAADAKWDALHRDARPLDEPLDSLLPLVLPPAVLLTRAKARLEAEQRKGAPIIEPEKPPAAKTGRPRRISAGHRESKPEVPLPKTWEELKSRGSISRKEAAGLLRWTVKTVDRRVKANELKTSEKGRIVCNERLRNQIRKVHGRQVLP
jgi:hypothetical protein